MSPEQVQQLCQALETEPVVSIRLNDKIDYLTFDADTEEVPWHVDGYYLSRRPQFTLDPLFHAGCYYVQEASSMFLGEVLNQYVKRDSIVLDMCAAPGGKSTLISQYLGEEVKRRIMIGNYALSAGYYDAYYLKALKVRRLVKEDYDKAFKEVDVIICPAAPSVAYKIGEKIDNPLEMYLQDACTVPLNLAGLPGISVPCGYNKDGMPIGMQIIGKALDEETLIRVAYTYEQSQSYHQDRAQLGGK